MAQTPATTWQMSDTIIVSGLGLIVIAIIITGFKFRPPLWRWLALLEAILLFELLGNCFVPGSWKQFWQLEIPVFLVTVVVGVASAKLQNKNVERTPFGAPQLIGIYIVSALVAVMLITH